jgi:hypothetical protein
MSAAAANTTPISPSVGYSNYPGAQNAYFYFVPVLANATFPDDTDPASTLAQRTASILIAGAAFYSLFGAKALANFSVVFGASGVWAIVQTGAASSFLVRASLPLTSAYASESAFLTALAATIA